jgi:hypothetical protein
MTLDPNAPVPPTTSPWSDLAPELRDSPYINKHSDLASLATEHINAQSMIGRKGIIPPKEGDLADTQRFLSDIGRPDTAEDYETGGYTPPEGIGWTPEFMTEVNALLHRSAVTQDQYPVLTQGYADLMQKQRESVFAQNDADGKQKVEAMKLELGSAYETHRQAGEDALKALYGENSNDILHLKLEDGSELGNHWLFTRGMIAIGRGGLGQGTGEDMTPVDKLGMGKVDGPLTPEKALEEINAKMGDEEFREMYFTANHAGHKQANNEMAALYQQAYPEGR